MRDLIKRLGEDVPDATRGMASAVPTPPWWPTERIDYVPDVVQISGSVMDVNSTSPVVASGALLDRAVNEHGVIAPITVTGSWADEADAGLDRDHAEPSEGDSIDVLAWYSSFHYCQYAWGIFIRSSGVEKLAREIWRRQGCTHDEAYRASWRFLYAHELTHFKVDLLITGAEFLAKKPLYLPGRARQSEDPFGGLYEEAFATAVARHALAPIGRRSLDDHLRRSPIGYRDWAVADVRNGWADAVGDVVVGNTAPVLWAPPGPSTAPYEADIPVFLIVDSPINPSLFSSAFVGPIDAIVETKPFQRDLRSLARGDKRVPEQWETRKRLLAQGSLGAGSHLEQIDQKRGLYSVRLDRSRRVGLRHDRGAGEWLAVAAGNHDQLYDRLKRLQVP
jgi:hypothetical protein